MSTPESDRDTILADLLDQAREHLRTGQGDLDLSDWLARHPDLADELPALIDTLQELETSVSQWRWLAGMTQTWTAPTLAAGPSDNLPANLGRYRVLGRIGAGGMGTVYRAEDSELQRVVAIKVPHLGRGDRQEVAERFLREAQAAARVQHPHIVAIHDVGVDAGRPFVVMEFVAGSSLSERLRGGHRLGSDREAATLCRQVAEALAALHSHGVIHRDLKPANILLDANGRALLTDFGLARPEDAGHLTQTGAVIGTPAYMSPEQAGGESDRVGPWSDIYSLGVVFYQMLTGQLPFDGPPLAVLARVRSEALPPPSTHRGDLDPALEAVVLRALARRPEDRYQTAAELLDDLARWESGSAPATLSAVAPASGKAPAKVRVELPDGTPVNVTVDVPVGAKQLAVQVRERPKTKNRPKQLAVLVTITLSVAFVFAGSLWWAVQDATEAQRHAANEAEGPRNLMVEAQHGLLVDSSAHLRRVEHKLSLHDDTESVRCVAFSLDGRLLASGGDRTFKVWDVATGQERLSLLARTGGAQSVSFSPDGKRIACVTRDQTVRLWDAETGQPLRELKVPAQPVLCVAMSPDGQRLVSGGQGTLKVWDAKQGRELVSLPGHTREVTSVAFSSDGERIVSGSSDRTVKVWSTGRPQPLLSLGGHTRAVTSVAFSPDGKRIASGSDDGTVQVWDAQSGQRQLSFAARSGVRSVAFSPDGKRVLCSGADNTLQVWEAAPRR